MAGAMATLAALMVFLFVLGISRSVRGAGVHKLRRLTELAHGQDDWYQGFKGWRSSHDRWMIRPLDGLAEGIGRVARPGSLEAIEKRLVTAGDPFGIRPAEFLAVRAFSSAVPAVVVAIYLMAVFALLRLAPILAAAAFGYMLPDLWLGRLIARRQAAILQDFPAALDLVVVCTDAGLNLPQALAVVTRELGGPLGEEFSRILKETSAGKSALTALRSMSRRVSLQPVSAFVNSVITAETLGTPVSQVFRLQASAARANQRHRAEEAIGKLPMKLTLVTVFFLLPGLFVVAVLPSVLSFLKTGW